ncbi:MAG: VWA domain-containing protein [Candidatus Woesearchaeota archaeon]
MIYLPFLGQVYFNNLYVFLIIPFILIIYFLVIRKKFVKIEDKKNLFLNRLMLLISRSIITLFLIIVMASPFTLNEEIKEGDPRITILFDNSSSMDVFDTSFVNEMQKQLNEKVPTTIRQIGSGNNSLISEGIFTNIDSGNLVLITDGQNYRGRDLISTLMLAKSENISIWAVNLDQIHEDYSVSIEGPSKVVEDVETEFIIKINNPSNKIIDLKLKIDGNIEFEKSTNENEIRFTKRFSEGNYRMIAEILVDDKIQENNKFYKSIVVIEKPKILFISEKNSPLLTLINKLYDVDTFNSLPKNLNQYLTVIVNDIDKLNNDEVNRLSNYVDKGNGLIFIGGENSFDRGDYKKSGIEKLLPVHFLEYFETPSQEVNVVLLLDKSGSTAFELREDMPGVNVVQGIAIDLINNIDKSTNIGAIAFNHRSEIISPIVSHFRFDELKEKILEIRARGMTDIRPAFNDAVEMLENRKGSKNIILISDGEDHIYMFAYRDMIRSALEKDIILHTINIGLEEYDNNMKILSDWGNGIFFTPENTNKFNTIFETPEGSWPLRKTSREHFITNNINLNSHITGFNLIQPKTYGQVLISTEFNDPILVIGRYGLGRIAVFATDDGSFWSSSILRNNPQLISRLINWGIENPQRNKDEYVDVSDSRIGENVKVYVKSQQLPLYQNLIFSKIDNDLYTTEFQVNKEGFYEIFNEIYAINYHRELLNIGMNEEYIEMVSSLGWDIINPNDINIITEQTLASSKYKVLNKNNISIIFIKIVIILLLIEFLFRRINRFRKNN